MTDQFPYILSSYSYWKRKRSLIEDNWKLVFPFTNHQWTDMTGDLCPICDGANSFIDNEESLRVYCICQLARILDTQTFKYESPLKKMKFSQLIPITPGQNCKDNDLHKAFAQGAIDLGKLKKFVSEWINDPKWWIAIEGNPGNGKTHILSVIKNTLPALALYISVEDLARKLFAGLKSNYIEEIIQELTTAPILLLDDFGAEHNTPFVLSQIHAVINYRYMSSPENFPVVMTTNLNLSELAASSNVEINRLISRMIDHQTSKVFHLSQPDFRNMALMQYGNAQVIA